MKIFSLSVPGSRPRLCLHSDGLVRQCWPGEDCSHLSKHDQDLPGRGREFLVFTDSCLPPAPCTTSLRERCRHYSTNSVSSREEEGESERILTVGIRRINIREDFTKYNHRVRDRLQHKPKYGEPVFSEYDDTDRNPNIIVNYLNQKGRVRPAAVRFVEENVGNINQIKHQQKYQGDQPEITVEEEFKLTSKVEESSSTTEKQFDEYQVSLLSLEQTTTPDPIEEIASTASTGITTLKTSASPTPITTTTTTTRSSSTTASTTTTTTLSSTSTTSINTEYIATQETGETTSTPRSQTVIPVGVPGDVGGEFDIKYILDVLKDIKVKEVTADISEEYTERKVVQSKV